MSASARRSRQASAAARRGVQAMDIDIVGDELPSQVTEEETCVSSGDAEDDGDDEDEDDEAEDEEDMPFPPPGLKEISSLASWTVSTAKPGNGVTALRSSDTNLFWQSDGPQPHQLSIHFFKLVSIAHIRIYLDFAADESYTPTKIQFLAGMGVHDLLEFAEMSFEQPSGWIDVDFSNVGPILDEEDEDGEDEGREIDWSKRPVLRAFLVQVKILENHQNGKDTHLRAVQLFAREDSQPPTISTVTTMDANAAIAKARSTAPTNLSEIKGLSHVLPKRQPRHSEPNNIKLASWMAEPDMR